MARSEDAERQKASPAADGGGSTGRTSWGRELYYRVRPSVVLVSRGNAEGTGFLFGSKRHIATALHVVEHTGQLQVTTASGDTQDARVVAWNREWDLAILELTRQLDAPVLEAARSGEAQVGDPVAAVGNPWGAEQRRRKGSKAPVWAISQGAISAPPADYVQTDSAVNPGNSGGPLLTADGRVVGVVVVRIAEADGISFATSVGRLTELTQQIGKQGELVPEIERLLVQVSWVAAAERQLSGVLLGGRFSFGRYWGVAARGARLWGKHELVSSFELTERDRWLLESELSLSLTDAEGDGLSLGAGGALHWDTVTNSTAVLQTGLISELRSEETLTRVRLMLSAAISAGPLLIDTAVYLLGPEGTGARLGLGVAF